MCVHSLHALTPSLSVTALPGLKTLNLRGTLAAARHCHQSQWARLRARLKDQDSGGETEHAKTQTHKSHLPPLRVSSRQSRSSARVQVCVPEHARRKSNAGGVCFFFYLVPPHRINKIRLSVPFSLHLMPT